MWLQSITEKTMKNTDNAFLQFLHILNWKEYIQLLNLIFDTASTYNLALGITGTHDFSSFKINAIGLNKINLKWEQILETEF